MVPIIWWFQGQESLSAVIFRVLPKYSAMQLSSLILRLSPGETCVFFRRIWDGNAVVVIVEGTEKKEEMRFSPYRLKIHGCRFHGYESVELNCREIEIISLAIWDPLENGSDLMIRSDVDLYRIECVPKAVDCIGSPLLFSECCFGM